MRARTALLLPLLLAVVLSACGGGGVSTQPAQPPTGVEGAWTLLSGSGPGGPLVLVPGSAVTLTVKAGEVGGTSACNSYGGPVRTSGGGFVPGSLAVTEMACADPAVNDLERAYLEALAKVTTARADADRLVLSGEGVTLTFSRDAPVVDLPVEGTTWILDTAFSGDTASTTVGRGTLRLVAGTLTARGGCRELRGGYTLDGTTLTTSGLGFVGDAAADCTADAGRQDEQLLAVLEQAVTVSVQGSRLTLMAGATGFGFTATPGQ